MRTDVTSSKWNTVNKFSHDRGGLKSEASIVVVIIVEECSGSAAQFKFIG
jgi:hypothetical protein